MSSQADLNALQACFDEAAGLNQEALNRLKEGATVDALAPLFERKAELNRMLTTLQNKFGHLEPLVPSEAYAAVFESQRQAANTETQLSERLAKFVPSNEKAVQAYKSNTVARNSPKVDNSF